MPASFRQGPRRPQKFFVPRYTYVGIEDLATSLVGVGAVTAVLSAKHNLAAGPVGIGRVTAALSVSHVLTTTPTGVGGLSGTLSLTHIFSVIVIGVAAVTGDLSGGSIVALPDGTETGWRRREQVQPPRVRRAVTLQARVVGMGQLKGAVTIWAPAFMPDELASIATLVDEEELAVLLAI